MPLQFLFHTITAGPPDWILDYSRRLFYSIVTVAVLVLIKLMTAGRSNTAERPLHGKVVLITGGTTGVGARVADELARRGAQLVLLTHVAPSDPFVAEYVQDLRDRHDNQLIYAEHVDLGSTHSIRKFATKWIDNAPPRRVDMIILAAATLTPPGGKRQLTDEGIEETWMVNYLANFHLLGILSPALRAQPIDRDVRVIMANCSSYIGSPSLKDEFGDKRWTPTKAYARSKLALAVFGQAYQKHLDAYKRPDGLPNNTKIIFVDPGMCRTSGMRRWLTRGSLTGLAIYVTAYFIPWLLLKSPNRGAQSFLHAAMDSNLGRGEGGRLVKECREVDFARPEVMDEQVAKKLWEESDALIEKVEKVQAKKRASRKAEDEKASKKREEKERADEVESLMGAIKRGKAKEKSSKDKKKDKDGQRANKSSSDKGDKSKSSKKKGKKTDS